MQDLDPTDYEKNERWKLERRPGKVGEAWAQHFVVGNRDALRKMDRYGHNNDPDIVSKDEPPIAESKKSPQHHEFEF
jgi:hypothetical protein